MKLCRDLQVLERIRTRETVSAWGEIDGFTRKENTLKRLVNQVSRAMVRALRPCYIVRVNVYEKGEPHVVAYRRGMVYTFAGSFAVPANDPELARLLRERDEAPYTGTADDARRVEAIYRRAEELGAVLLSWY